MFEDAFDYKLFCLNGTKATILLLCVEKKNMNMNRGICKNYTNTTDSNNNNNNTYSNN